MFYFGQSVYDKHLGTEFQSEINTLREVGHLNLVKFYGYLVHEDEKLVVVEYVPNGTLREHLECKCSLSHCLVLVCECLFLFSFLLSVVVGVGGSEVWWFTVITSASLKMFSASIQVCMALFLTLQHGWMLL